MKHIEIETLIRKFEGRLAAGEEADVTLHLAACGDCGSKASKLADFFAYAGGHTAEEVVPQATTARILNIYQREPAAVKETARFSPNILSLIFDDWQTAVNERHFGSDSRQLLYRSGEFEIDLRLEMVEDKCRLTGQIFPEIDGAASVDLIAETHTAAAAANEFGEFSFDLVPQGDYDLQISTNGQTLKIEKIPLHR